MKRDIGKRIGGSIYIHRNYAYVVIPIEILDWAISVIPPTFTYDIIKYNYRGGKISFIQCSEFNVSQWPVVEDAYVINIHTRKIKFIPKAKDPWIYHHKWMMVDDDYLGFNRQESKDLEMWWATAHPWIDKSRIGKKSYWYNVVVPRILQAINKPYREKLTGKA